MITTPLHSPAKPSARGHITVLDRPKLEKQVCECYAVVRKEMDRLLPDKTLR